ncbi:CaiF/GrlA family transcriptional regulator [Salmonella enterica subsp. enterica]|nr:CaiF/GrlA family transcriptional regulator [Salmonella enterica subsp. enterica]
MAGTVRDVMRRYRMAEEKAGKGGRHRRAPQQSNHDACMVPAGLEAWADRPLYILVAQWCLKQGGWVNRGQIARAFGISERSATFQLTYLSRKKTQITCELRKVRREGAPVVSYEVKVSGVSADAGKREGKERPRKSLRTASRGQVGNADGEIREQARALWNSLQRGRKE